jgi:hypothetical protein
MRFFIQYDALIFDNKQYSILKTINHSFFEIIMGAKGWFYCLKFFFFCSIHLFDFIRIFLFVFSESSMSPPPYDYDPFDSLRQNGFSDEEYEHCFRYFDSQK